MAITHEFTKREEVANAAIHGIGTLLSVAALVLLIVFSSIGGSLLSVGSAIVYGGTMLLLYLCSTLVHSFPKGRLKDLFEILDHSAIYLFIAGSYTPIFLRLVQGNLGWVLFGLVWGIAIVGVVFKIFFVKRFLFTSTLIYILMGWMVIFVWKPLITHLNGTGLQLLVAGGCCYTIGTIFYVWRGFRYHHAIWHLFVLAGSIFQFFSIFLFVLPH